MTLKKRSNIFSSTDDAMVMEMLEPRTLLSADALAMAGLPGIDHQNDDTPWKQVSLHDAEVIFSTALAPSPTQEAPLQYSTFTHTSTADDTDAALHAVDGIEPSPVAASADRVEVVVVDTRVSDYQQLLEDIRGARPDVELVTYLIDETQRGVAAIGDALANYEGVDALHLISHGDNEGLLLGKDWLTNANLADHADALRDWSGHFSDGADLLVYGCNAAADAQGRILLDDIASLTGTDLAASDDLTGKRESGGDWDLEYRVGEVETAAIFATDHQTSFSGVLNEEYVDEFSTGDYAGSDGATPWTDPWQESNDSGNESGGDISVDGVQLVISEAEKSDPEITRSVDLSGPGTATLSFDYQRQDADPAGGSLSVEVFDGTVWNQVASYDLDTDDAVPVSESIDITAYKDASSEIGFFKNTPSFTGASIIIDNVRIELVDTNAPTSATGLSSTASYTEGDASVAIDDIVVSDSDANETITATLTLADTNTGTLTANDGASYSTATGEWAITDTVANVNAALANLVFSPEVNNDQNTTIGVVIDDGDEDGSGPLTGTIALNVAAQNDAPVLSANSLTLTQGDVVPVTTSIMNGNDVEDVDTSLTVTVSNVTNGHFALATDTGAAINSFTLGDVVSDSIRFVHDGGELAPQYSVTVTDSGGASSGPDAAAVTFNDSHQGVLWLSTKNDQAAGHSVPGLSGEAWSKGDILQFAGTDLSFGETTTAGTFSVAFDASDFSASADVNGMHYVTSAITIGSTNAVDLLPGDLLLTTRQDGDVFVSNGGTPEADLTVNTSDVFFFRPDQHGDYGKGNFFRLLTIPVGGAEIRGISLVEQTVDVGDYTLTQGHIVYSQSGASDHSSFYILDTAGIDPTDSGTFPTAQLLINGEDAGVDLDDQVFGIDVLEKTTTIGGQTYDAGTILTAINRDDLNGIGSTNQPVREHDIVALAVQQTTLVAGSAMVDAQILFDGDDVDVGFASTGVPIDGLTLTVADDGPVLGNNTLSLSQGEVINIDSAMLSATDVDNADDEITFTVSDAKHGYFAYAANTTSPISTFTQADIIADSIRFVHYGGELAPSYDITVSDGQGGEDGPIEATINFTNTADGVLWLSTNSGASGFNSVPGLGGVGWQGGDILQQAGTNLSFGKSSTDGWFSVAFDISNFSADANVNGLHFVSSGMTVGAVNSVALEAGDVLLTISENGKVLTSNGAAAPADLTVNKDDIVYFRPDQVGDYSQGNFHLLLSDPFGGDKDVRGLSLVEQDVLVGDHWLRQGDLLLGGGDDVNDIWLFDTTGIDLLDHGTYPVAEQLIDNADAGVDIDSRINGLDVLETETTIGGKTYTAGTLLIAVETDDADGVGTNAEETRRRDVIALDVSTTTLGAGAGNAQVDGEIMFDGSDTGFIFAGEPLDGLSLTVGLGASNSLPVLGSNLLSVVEGASTALTPAMLSATDADSPDSNLIFNVSSVSGGQFEVVSNPGNAVASFTQAEITGSQVVFVDDGDETAPSFDISVSDGVATTATVAGGITFTQVNDAPRATNLVSTSNYLEGDTAVAIADIAINDDDVGDTITATLTLANTAAGALSANNGATYSGVTGVWTITNTVANVNAALANLVFNPNVDNDEDTTISVVIDDGDEDGGGPLTGTVTLSVTPADDSPVVGDVTANQSEDDAGSTLDLLANSSDPDTADTLSVINLTLTGGDAAGITDNGDGTLAIDPSRYNALAAGETEVITYSYDVSDGTTTAGATATITINGADDVPLVGAVTASVSEDDPASSFDLLTNSIDPDTADSLTVSNLTLTAGDAAGISDNGDGTLTVDPSAYGGLAAGESEVITYSFDVSDGNTTLSTTATLTVAGVNDDPSAGAVTATATEDDAGFGLNLLANSNDVDANDTLSVSNLNITGGDGSGIIDNGDGTLTISPNAYAFLADGETEVVTYSFNVSDGTATIATTATITITGADDAFTAGAVTYTTNKGAPAATLDLLGNSNDPDATDVLTAGNVVLVSGDAGGITDNGDGTLSIDPTAYSGLGAGVSEVIQYNFDVSDGTSTVSTTATITVNGANTDPVVNPVSMLADEDDPAATLDLLANSSDADTSDTLTVSNLTLINGDASGVTDNGDGTLAVDPGAYNTLALGENVVITYGYDVSDGSVTVGTTATININGANDLPTVSAVNAAASEDDGLSTVDLLSGSSDADTTDTLTVTNLSLVSGDAGGVTDNGDGTFTLDPNVYDALAVGESEVITYSYDVSDGISSIANTVTITVNGANDTLAVGAVATNADETTPAYVLDLLANSSDPDTNDALAVSNLALVSGNADGIVDNGDGTLAITPGAYTSLAAGEAEVITYSFDVSDGTDTVGTTATITINGVNNDPNASPLTTSATEDDAVFDVDLLSNSSDDDTTDVLTITGLVVTGGDASGITDNGDGTLTVDPNAYNALGVGESETITFSYGVGDGTTTVNTTATITITGVNDDASVGAVSTALGEDDAATTLDLLGNASDPDLTDSLSVSNIVLTGGNALGVTDNGDGTLSIDPGAHSGLADGESEMITFTYDVSDGTTTSGSTATITISGANDNPSVAAVTRDVDDSDATLAVDLLSGSADVDATDTLVVNNLTLTAGDASGVSDHGNGTLSIDPGAYRSLALGESEVITYSYDVSDGTASIPTTITITVNGSNDAPVVVVSPGNRSGTQDLPINFQIPAGTFNDVDDTDTLIYSARLSDGSALPGWLTFDDTTQTFSGTPTSAAVGTLDIVVEARDGNGGTADAQFTLNVANVNDLPQGAAIITGTPKTGDTLTADTSTINDADGIGNFSFQWLRDGVNIAGATNSTYSPNDADVGSEVSVIVRFTDLQGTDETVISASTMITAGSTPVTETYVDDDGPTDDAGDVVDAAEPVEDEAITQTPTTETIVAPDNPKVDDIDRLVELPEVGEVAAVEMPVDDPFAPTALPAQPGVSADFGAATPPGPIDNTPLIHDQPVVSDTDNAAHTSMMMRNPVTALLLGAPEVIVQPIDAQALVGEIRSVFAYTGFVNELDGIRDDYAQATFVDTKIMASSVAVTTGLSVGYVIWLMRAGVLLSTVLSSLPAWQFVDPLPVLARSRKQDRDTDETDEDSVEAMFDN